MEENGKVTAIKDNMATVEIERKSQCGNCGLCGLKAGANTVSLELENECGAKKGDTVQLFIDDANTLWISIVCYLMPVVLGIIALVVTLQFTDNLLIGTGAFLGALAAGFAILIPVNKTYEKKHRGRHRLVKVVEHAQPEETNKNNFL